MNKKLLKQWCLNVATTTILGTGAIGIAYAVSDTTSSGGVTPTPTPTPTPDPDIITPVPFEDLDIDENGCLLGFKVDKGQLTAYNALEVPKEVSSLKEDLFLEYDQRTESWISTFPRFFIYLIFDNDCPIEEISREAFNSAWYVDYLILPPNLKTLKPGCFGGMISLRSLDLPSSLQTIGIGSFKACSSLINVTIPEGCKFDGFAQFMYCRSLMQVTLPSNITTIPQWAFSECDNLMSINLDNITQYDEYAFENSGIKKITFGSNVTKVKDEAFNKCFNLKEITFKDWPNLPTWTGNNIFANLSGVSSTNKGQIYLQNCGFSVSDIQAFLESKGIDLTCWNVSIQN